MNRAVDLCREHCCCRLVLCFLLFLRFTTGEAQTVYVPNSHRIYRYIERLTATGTIETALLTTRPWTRKEIGAYLEEIHRKSDGGRLLSRVDRQALAYFTVEFREEVDACAPIKPDSMDFRRLMRHRWVDPWMPDLLYRNGRNFFSVQDGPLVLYWDPVFRRSRLFAVADTLHDRERQFSDTNGFVLWGTIGGHVGFITDVRDSKEWGTQIYPGTVNVTRERLGFAQGGGDHLYHDETAASVVLDHRWLTVQFGKDNNRWGPVQNGQLALSDWATGTDQVKLQVRTRRIKFTSLWALLQHTDEGFFYGNHQDKSFAAHRLEFAPFGRLQIGIHETVVYADRRFEPAYLNPLMFFRSAEHYLGDRDNATMGIDALWSAPAKLQIYGEYFIDDLKTSRWGSDFYGNKTAWSVGCYRVDLLGIDNLDGRVEYTRIRPFVYSHKFPLTAYRHFSTVLGHRLGPNADEWNASLSLQPSRPLEMLFGFRYRRQGLNSEASNVGSDIDRPSGAGDGENAPFLAGDRLEQQSWNVDVRWELLRKLTVRAAGQWSRTDGSAVEKTTGKRSIDRTEWAVGMEFNY